jgi:hypothetical protein
MMDEDEYPTPKLDAFLADSNDRTLTFASEDRDPGKRAFELRESDEHVLIVKTRYGSYKLAFSLGELIDLNDVLTRYLEDIDG